jgi:hypothetical protein
MIFAVSFEIIIQRVVSNEPCDVIKNTLIIRSKKFIFRINYSFKLWTKKPTYLIFALKINRTFLLNMNN